MRTLIPFILVGAIGFAVYNYRAEILRTLKTKPAAAATATKAHVASSAPKASLAPVPESPESTADIPVSTPVVVPVAPLPQNRVAPAGRYFLTQRVSIATNDGVFAAMPGEIVQLMYRNKNGTVHVMMGKNDFDVREDQLTKELDPNGRPVVHANVLKGAVAAQH